MTYKIIDSWILSLIAMLPLPTEKFSNLMKTQRIVQWIFLQLSQRPRGYKLLSERLEDLQINLHFKDNNI